MFGIGGMELAIVAVVVLMLFSPKELPKMLRSAARFWGQIRATADEFKDTIMSADGVDEITELAKKGKKGLRSAEAEARRELMKARVKMRDQQQKLAKMTRASEDLKRREEAAKLGPQPEDDAGGPDTSGEANFPLPKPEPTAAPEANPAATTKPPAVPPPPATNFKPPAPPPPKPSASDGGSKGDVDQGAA